jgi:acyl-CoA synthetase (AMP-forming)/AMP-acid ligase II
MKGYWKHEQATAEAIEADSWFKTGDIARVDEDGYFFIVDRKKDLVIRGGYNVPARDRGSFYDHPDVREAAMIGIPHDEIGQEVAAAIALKTGADSTPGELRAFVSSASPPTSTPVTSGSSTISPRADRQDPQARDRTASRRCRTLSREDPTAVLPVKILARGDPGVSWPGVRADCRLQRS